MIRVKLFHLSENVQAVLVKSVNDSDQACISVAMYTGIEGADVQFNFPMAFKSTEGRDEAFDTMRPSAIVSIYNTTVERSELPLELITN